MRFGQAGWFIGSTVDSEVQQFGFEDKDKTESLFSRQITLKVKKNFAYSFLLRAVEESKVL